MKRICQNIATKIIVGSTLIKILNRCFSSIKRRRHVNKNCVHGNDKLLIDLLF